MHHGLDKLLFTSLRIFLFEREHLYALIRKLGKSFAHCLNCFRFVFLDAYDGAHVPEHLLHQSGPDDDLLGALQHDAEVACEIRLALCSVQNQAFRLASGSGIEFYVRGEGCAAKANNAARLDAVEDELPVIGNIRNKSIGKIDTIHPFISLYGNLDMGNVIACEVFARGY